MKDFGNCVIKQALAGQPGQYSAVSSARFTQGGTIRGVQWVPNALDSACFGACLTSQEKVNVDAALQFSYVDFGVKVCPGGTWTLFEGLNIKTPTGPSVATTVKISVNDLGMIEYRVNDVLVYTSTSSVNYPFEFAVVILSVIGEGVAEAQWLVPPTTTSTTTSTTSTPCLLDEPCEADEPATTPDCGKVTNATTTVPCEDDESDEVSSQGDDDADKKDTPLRLFSVGPVRLLAAHTNAVTVSTAAALVAAAGLVVVALRRRIQEEGHAHHHTLPGQEDAALLPLH